MRTDVKRFEEFWVTESEIQDERSVVGLAVSSCLVFTGFALVNLTYIDASYCIRAPSVFFQGVFVSLRSDCNGHVTESQTQFSLSVNSF